jgi:hypothetical protein
MPMVVQSAPRPGLHAASLLLGLAILAALAVAPASAQSLYGSHESLLRQNLVTPTCATLRS